MWQGKVEQQWVEGLQAGWSLSKPGPSQRDSGVTNVMLIKLLDMIIPKQHNIRMSTEIHAMQRGVHVYVLHTTVCVALA